MTPPPDGLPPEWLAAYADGELDDVTRARVEAWLAANPEAAEDVAAQQRLVRLWREADPPPLSEAAWSAALARVESALARPNGRAGRRVAGIIAGLLGLAAAVLVIVVLNRPGPADDEPLPVASADDVRIESVDEADLAALIVGEPPVRAPLELLTMAEVKVHAAAPDDSGRTGRVETTEENTGVPMIVMPPVVEPGKEP